jgi:hypothetical protein
MHGLEPYFDKSEVAWPSTERMKEFYKTHSSAKLMEKDKAEEKSRNSQTNVCTDHMDWGLPKSDSTTAGL